MAFRISTPEVALHLNNLLSLAEFANRNDRGCWPIQTKSYVPQVYGHAMEAIKSIIFQELKDASYPTQVALTGPEARSVADDVLERCSAVAPVESVTQLVEIVNDILIDREIEISGV